MMKMQLFQLVNEHKKHLSQAVCDLDELDVENDLPHCPPPTDD